MHPGSPCVPEWRSLLPCDSGPGCPCCAISEHRPVCRMWMARQGEQRERIWLAVRAAGAIADAGICAVSTLWRTKSGRLPTALELSGPAHRLCQSDTGADRGPPHGHTASLPPWAALPAASASTPAKEGCQDSPLVTISQPLGSSAESPSPAPPRCGREGQTDDSSPHPSL